MRAQKRFPRGMIAKMCWLLILCAVPLSPAFGQTLSHFTFSTITSPRQAYVPFRIIITARSSTGATVRNFTGTVQLTASGPGGAMAAEAFSTLRFTSGQWVGNVSVNEPGTNVTLRVDDLAGHTGTSAPFQVDPASFRVIDSLPVISMASDRTRGVLYASVGPVASLFGTIHVIDPATRTIIASRPIIGGVGRIEISPDASKLYVVTDDETTVRRLRLPDFVQEVSLDMGESEPGMLNRADDLAVHPSNPNTVAITKSRREYSPRFTGVSVFEGAFERRTPSVHVASANALAWGAQPNRLYGLDNESSPAEFIQYEVTTTNITAVAGRQNTLAPFNGQIEFINGRLYCTTGRIIDPETFTIFAELANGDADALMLSLPDRKRIIYFTPDSIGLMLTYDTETWQLLGSDPFPMPRGQGSGVAFWGTNGIAFHDGQRLFLAESPWIPTGAAADIQVTAVTSQGAPVGVGVEQDMRATVRNLGPNDAGSILIKITGPPDATLVDGSLVGLNAEKKVASREITLRFPSLAAGASAEVEFIARSNVEAWEPFSVLATSAGVDPNSSNNAALIVLKAAPALGPASPVLFRFPNTAQASDRTRGTVLLTSSSPLAPWGNSVVTINPTNGEISQPALVGPRPSELATSDDGRYLYVGLQGTPEVRRFLLPDMTHDLTLPLGADGWSGPRFAGQMEVRPGHSTDIAVTRFSGSNDRLAFFRNGVDVPVDRGSPETVHFAGPDRIIAHEEGWAVFRLTSPRLA
jgi:DNA-binding beta-propeller fold protein YncE